MRRWYHTDCPLHLLSDLGEDTGHGVWFGLDEETAYAVAHAHLERAGDCGYCAGLLAQQPNRWTHESAVRSGYAQPLESQP